MLCARTLGWLQAELGAVPVRLQVSADTNKLQQQLERHKPLYLDLTQQEHELIILLAKGKIFISLAMYRYGRINAISRSIDYFSIGQIVWKC